MKKMKRFFSLASVMMFTITFLAGCGESTKMMKDREGTEFKVPEQVNRIISTAPSNTEVLVGLGLADKLVAIDNYSTDVEGVNKDLPKIDFRNPDPETIIELKPDMVIASGHNKAGDQDPFALIKEAGIPVVYVPVSNSIDGIYGDIEFMAQVTKTDKKGQEIVENMKKEVGEIKAIGDKITNKKKVYFEIGSGPVLSSFGENTFLNEMINIIGAENIFANEKAWISPTPESIIAANPDVILSNMIDTNGKNPVEDIKSREGWGSIKAIKDGDVYEIDTNASSRPSQHIIKALREMAKAVYPNEYK